MAEKIFSEIPLRTWRWLGVNEAKIEESILLADAGQNYDIAVPAGEKRELTVVRRGQGHGTVKAVVAEGGSLELAEVHLTKDGACAGETTVDLAASAQLTATSIEAGTGESASQMQVVLSGDNSKADVCVLYFVDGTHKLDMNYILRQQGKNTEANLQVYGALAGQAEKIFRGTLDFQRGAKGSKGCEREQVVVLSDKVRNRSVPLMLSAEEKVEGHHAVSIGKIDGEKLFYLLSRGLDMAEAKRLLVEAISTPALERIADAALRQEVADYMEGRLADE